jgi:hypothetical protein
MKLLVFPGSASPCNSLYREVYQLLRSGAKKYGYQKVDTSLRWPGHFDSGGRSIGKLTLDGAVDVATRKVRQFERAGQPYDILARSFGNYVAMKTILNTRPKLLRRLILWAPPPYWVLWKMFVRDRTETEKIAREKWLAFDEAFFPSVIPLETMVPELGVPCVAATGTEDKYCAHKYLNYLKGFATGTEFTVQDVVAGAIHEVHPGLGKPVVAAYLKALFSKMFRPSPLKK